MSELKPCPFCGSEDYYIAVTDNPFSYDTYSTTHCSKCHATGPFVAESYLEDEPKPTRDYMEAVAKEKWQTRPIEDDLRKRIAELTECVGSKMADVYTLKARIAELEALVERLIEAGNWLNAMHEDGVFVDELNAARTSWKLAVSDWQSMPSHVTNPLESQGIVTRNGGEG